MAMTSPRPLEGRTIVITASRRASEQASLVSRLGGSAYVVPTVGISLAPDDGGVEKFLRSITEIGTDYVVFMTGPGVHSLLLAARKLLVEEELVRMLNSKGVKVVARSGKPKTVLARFGIKVDAMPPPGQATTEGVVSTLRRFGLSGKKVAIMWHGAHPSSTREELISAGAESVLECSTYSYSRRLDGQGADLLSSMGFSAVPPEDERLLSLIRELIAGERVVDAITFTSPPAVRHFFEAAEERGLEEELRLSLSGKVCLAAVGPSTKKALEEHGVEVDVVPGLQAMGAMMTALGEYFGRRTH